MCYCHGNPVLQSGETLDCSDYNDRADHAQDETGTHTGAGYSFTVCPGQWLSALAEFGFVRPIAIANYRPRPTFHGGTFGAPRCALNSWRGDRPLNAYPFVRTHASLTRQAPVGPWSVRYRAAWSSRWCWQQVARTPGSPKGVPMERSPMAPLRTCKPLRASQRHLQASSVFGIQVATALHRV